ncbi:LysM peptidoglycan-binding domain-containing protein [Thiothrix nivea]|uniref:LysM peptidoglycan-binding domain-containing protein n=1 Tax=Thiothrix nivea TaxID=1031 RepID=UPI0002E3B895|nr:LysM peptidoglycan-binding domain-containing protein [Thiothrix nivea]
MSVSNVVKTIRNTGVRRAVLLVDACRNDPRPGIRSGETSFEDVDSGEGVQVFYSTRFGDVSWEHDAFKHGVFSHFLVQGLSGQGTQNGLVTFNSLANYVEQQVADWTSSNMSQTQQPFRRSDGDFFGDFVLARPGNGNAVSLSGEQGADNRGAYYDYSGGASDVTYNYVSAPAASTTYYDYAPSSTVLNQQDTYLVQPRDTIFQVMRNTGVYWKDLVELNNLDAPDYVLTPGQVIRLR